MLKKNIVFLPIGKKQCGDSLAIRLWDDSNPSNQKIILIDGGYKDDSKKVIDLVTNNFEADKVDLIISTHLDKDHIAGLPGVLESIQVGELWMHLPWDHSDEFLASRQEEFGTLKATNWLKNSLSNSNDLALAADAAGIIPEEPFAGLQYFTDFGTFTVLSPTVEYYESLLPAILDKSASKATAVTTSLSSVLAELMGPASRAGESIKKKLEDHDIETLSNIGDTTPSNNSSTVILLELVNGEKILFTGDAGKEGLEIAYGNFVSLGHSTGELKFIQVPHHGSRKNVGPNILNKFLGGKTEIKDQRRGTAFVSAVLDCAVHGHPKKSTTNAFRRRGYPVFQSGNVGIKHGNELKGYNSPVTPLPLFTEVEGDDL